MEKPVRNSIVLFDDTPQIINETVSSSLTSIEKKQWKGSIGKSGNNHHRSSLKFHQPNIPGEAANNLYISYSDSQQYIIPSAQVPTKRMSFNRNSVGENKLNKIIEVLNENPLEEHEDEEPSKEHETSLTGCRKSISRSRHFIVHLMEQPKFHYAVIVLIIIDLIIVFIELVISQLSLPCLTDDEMLQYNTTIQRTDCLLPRTNSSENGELALFYLSLIIISLFVIEILTAFYGFGWRRYTKFLFLLDAIIVLASFILEVYFHFGNIGKIGRAAAGLVVLRLWKIIRAIHAIAHSMSLRNHMIVTDIKQAQKLLNAEKIQAENRMIDAENRIIEQQIEIDYLKNLVQKKANETNQSPRSRIKSLDYITLF